MKTTIYDVAKEANVSISTVSKVLNHTGNISEKRKKNLESDRGASISAKCCDFNEKNDEDHRAAHS